MISRDSYQLDRKSSGRTWWGSLSVFEKILILLILISVVVLIGLTVAVIVIATNASKTSSGKSKGEACSQWFSIDICILQQTKNSLW